MSRRFESRICFWQVNNNMADIRTISQIAGVYKSAIIVGFMMSTTDEDA